MGNRADHAGLDGVGRGRGRGVAGGGADDRRAAFLDRLGNGHDQTGMVPAYTERAPTVVQPKAPAPSAPTPNAATANTGLYAGQPGPARDISAMMNAPMPTTGLTPTTTQNATRTATGMPNMQEMQNYRQSLEASGMGKNQVGNAMALTGFDQIGNKIGLPAKTIAQDLPRNTAQIARQNMKKPGFGLPQIPPVQN